MLACLAGTRLGVDPQWGGGEIKVYLSLQNWTQYCYNKCKVSKCS